jgi:hypothetical protein
MFCRILVFSRRNLSSFSSTTFIAHLITLTSALDFESRQFPQYACPVCFASRTQHTMPVDPNTPAPKATLSQPHGIRT